MKAIASLLIVLCAHQGGCVLAQDTATPPPVVSSELEIKLTVNNVTSLRSISSGALSVLIESVKQENPRDNQFYYVTVHRPEARKIHKFYLIGPRAAKADELNSFMLIDSDEVYFGRILP